MLFYYIVEETELLFQNRVSQTRTIYHYLLQLACDDESCSLAEPSTFLALTKLIYVRLVILVIGTLVPRRA